MGFCTRGGAQGAGDKEFTKKNRWKWLEGLADNGSMPCRCRRYFMYDVDTL